MGSAALYGVTLGVVTFVFTKVAPQPAGAITFWSLSCLQLAWIGLTCFRRTGLPFLTAALINGSVLSAGMVAIAGIGQPYPNLGPATWVLFGCGAATGPLFLVIESRVNRERWRELRRHMEGKTILDILTGRHFPDLRGHRA